MKITKKLGKISFTRVKQLNNRWYLLSVESKKGTFPKIVFLWILFEKLKLGTTKKRKHIEF